MIKTVIFLINVLAVFFISHILSEDVSVKMIVPETVQAGQEFQVAITVSKGTLESFSRIQQDVPYGLTASRIATANADFTFENQRVRFIWLKLPADPSITVVYRMMVDERLKGSFSLEGEFSFIKGNERKNINIQGPEKIIIIPAPYLAEDQIIDINDFQKYYLTHIEKEEQASRLECTRRDPVQTSPREIIVELFVNKGNIDKFAKIEEYIPAGFIASEVDSKNGIFSFENSTVKILWMNLPDEQEFTVKYRLFPEKGKTVDDLKLSGSFSYITGNQTKTFEILEKKPDLAIMNGVNKADPIIIIEEEVSGAEKTVKDEHVAIDIKEEPVIVQQETKPVIPEFAPDGYGEFLLRPEQGVYYRVQLAAGHNPVNIRNYFIRLRVNQDVKFEFHEGWRKYTVGSFYEYRQARDHRMDIWNSTPINDAFVAAYNNGQRITVQEALMITSQNWVR